MSEESIKDRVARRAAEGLAKAPEREENVAQLNRGFFVLEKMREKVSREMVVQKGRN